MPSEQTDIRYIKGVGERRAELFSKLGISSVGTLLRLYPRSYEDWSEITPISSAPFFEKCCIRAFISSEISETYIRKGMTIYKFFVSDATGKMQVTVFNNKYLIEKLVTGNEYLFYGTVSGNFFNKELSSPEIRNIGYNYIRPIYNTTASLSQTVIENVMREALKCELNEDVLPESIRQKYNLCDIRTALNNIHFPASKEAYLRARRRLIFEELFLLQTGLLLLKQKKNTATSVITPKNYKSDFLKLLSFELTNAQLRVIDECLADMSSGKLMNRLVQGDVGSGKTAVAAALTFNTVKNNYQAAFMAPTEILAIQHYNTFCSLFEGTDIKCELLTGSLKKKDKERIKSELENGTIDVIIGTHALITDDVAFNNLGLVITDEQHRFGVAQRAALSNKGNNPHTLVMSATPIPRTMGLVIYGDLDISIIDEYPKNRQKIESYCVDNSYTERIYAFIKKHIDKGLQAYVVCPLIEKTDENTDNLISAEDLYKSLSEKQFASYSVGLLHGKQKPNEKDKIMTDFKEGKISLLVSTTVIEVGVDVPNAVIMVIENAEHFGLSQLHQLRGRIGRGTEKSTCIFLLSEKNAKIPKRLQILCATQNGFEIADEDLKLRGPGDFLGKRQHGLPDLKIADMAQDINVLKTARREAANLLSTDKLLLSDQNKPLADAVKNMFIHNT